MATTKQKAAPHTPRSRSADEMHQAIEALTQELDIGKGFAIPPNYDTPGEILQDAIAELLELRQLRANVLAFTTEQQPLLARR